MRTYLIKTTDASVIPAEIIEEKQHFAKKLFITVKNLPLNILLLIWVIRGYIFIIGLSVYLIWGTPELQNAFINYMAKKNMFVNGDEKVMNAFTNDLEKQANKSKTQFSALTPNSNYLVINSTENEFFLYKKKELVRNGKCSTGSYIMLKNGDNQEWIFKTPKGMFSIKGKTTNPVWKKPDWAFVEEGMPIPSANDPSRFEYGVLGDYALSLGDGYMLHGTLYKRFIGLPVTHGCVRLGDDDLKAIYNSLSVGSKVIIY
jgi:hypothetical protein